MVLDTPDRGKYVTVNSCKLGTINPCKFGTVDHYDLGIDAKYTLKCVLSALL